MSAFTAKNEARKLSYTGGKQDHDARRRRRIYGGTFGLAPNHIYNELAVGTTAVTRTGKDAQS